MMGYNTEWIRVLSAIERGEVSVKDVVQPPCCQCRWWQPQVINATKKKDEVVLCNSIEVFPNFLCFQPRESMRKEEMVDLITKK